MRHLRKHQNGDTIVEVLIAIAIISMVLATGYAITNRNLALTQDTQEQSQAQEILQHQVEDLRAMSSDGTISGFAQGDCVIGNGGALQFSNYNTPACNFFPNGNLGGCSTEPCYRVKIDKNALGAYEATVNWNNIHGTDVTQELDYRL
jgi:prepilin-type N-terminal cleavage/methylation domain-containing protein